MKNLLKNYLGSLVILGTVNLRMEQQQIIFIAGRVGTDLATETESNFMKTLMDKNMINGLESSRAMGTKKNWSATAGRRQLR